MNTNHEKRVQDLLECAQQKTFDRKKACGIVAGFPSGSARKMFLSIALGHLRQLPQAKLDDIIPQLIQSLAEDCRDFEAAGSLIGLLSHRRQNHWNEFLAKLIHHLIDSSTVSMLDEHFA